MYKMVKTNVALLSLTASSFMLLPWASVEARNAPPEEAPRGRPAQAEARAAEPRVNVAQEREAQAQAVRAEQEQAGRQHADEMKQAAAAREQQESALRAQEQQSRKAQQDAMKEQQEQARAQQEQARAQQAQGREQQSQARPQQQSRADRAQARGQVNTAMVEHGGAPGGQPGSEGHEHGGQPAAFVHDRGGNPVSSRAAAPPQLTVQRMPLEKAIAMPIIDRNASAADREHLQQVQNNLQAHMYAVAAADAPSNYHDLGRLAREAYFNNYQANIANQILTINRQNTFINALEQNQWPAWYQPEPNWQFCNGFTLGNAINCDLNWLRWGWHPYYGPQPEGFVCSRNYMPTPWIYLPAYGTWRQPGVNSYAAYGPPFDYTGPISVEVFEPRQVSFDVPFLGMLPQRVINAVYFYNAFYYPDFGRYGYMNRHNNWIWLNLGTSPF